MNEIDTSPETVARKVDALRRASGRFDILDCEAALQVADIAEALASRLAELGALDSVDKAHAWDAISAKNTCIAALEADAAAARKSASANHARAEAAEAERDRLAAELAAARAKLDLVRHALMKADEGMNWLGLWPNERALKGPTP